MSLDFSKYVDGDYNDGMGSRAREWEADVCQTAARVIIITEKSFVYLLSPAAVLHVDPASPFQRAR